LEADINTFLASLENKLEYSESTRVSYYNDLRIFQNFLEHLLKRKPTLDDFNRDRVVEFFEAEIQSGRKYNTLLRRRATLQRFEKYLLDSGVCTESRLGKLQVGDFHPYLSKNKPKEQPVFLSEEELNRLISLLANSTKPLARRDHAIFSLLLETGLSTSSLTAVDLTDLDLNSQSIHIKLNSQIDCWLPMGEAADLVAKYLKYGRPELNPTPEEPALFISQNGVRMSRQSIWQIFRQWGRSAEIKEALSPRILRHTAVAKMVKAGRPLGEIQALLGHRNSLSTYALLQRLSVGRPYGETQLPVKDISVENYDG
jgi:integrase/recombinase XerD